MKQSKTTPSASIPVQNIVYIKGKQYDATEDSVCYDSMWRKIREDKNGNKYLLVNMMIIYLDKPNPLPSILVKDELDITKGEWYVTKSSANSTAIATKTDYSMIAIVADWRKERASNAKAICTAVNNTYGKGYNPAAMEELYKALLSFTENVDDININGVHVLTIDPELFKQAQTALTNCKL